MTTTRLSLLRGVCQMPAYAAFEKGFIRDEGLEVRVDVQPTAWMVPEKLAAWDVHFAVIPWTRVAVSEGTDKMKDLGYVDTIPTQYCDLLFLDQVSQFKEKG